MRALALVLLLGSVASYADYMDHFVIRDDVGVRKAPYLGPAEILVIPVEVAGHPTFDLAELTRFFTSNDPDGFVKFHETASLGRYKPHVTVAPVVAHLSCPLPPQFTNCSVARGDVSVFAAGIDFLRESVRLTDANGVDFSKLDVNGRRGTADGWVDGVMLITNTPFGGIAFPFGYFNRGDNLAGGMGGPLVVDGVKIGHIAITGSRDQFSQVHEFGHLQGLTDLYDQSFSYPGLHFSLMGGCCSANLKLHDAESRFRLRWADWHQVQGRQRVRIGPAETTGEVWRLGVGDEYFLIENRGPGGVFDKQFTARGLAVYHVDRRVKLKGDEGKFQDRILDGVNDDKWHPYILNLQADGLFELQASDAARPDYENDLFRDGDALGADSSGTPFSADHPVASTNYYSGTPSGIFISDITVTPEGPIDVTLEAPGADQCNDRLCDEGVGCAPVTCESPGAWKVGGCGCNVGAEGALGLGLLLLLEQRLRRRQQRVFRG
ncbi:MAG: hypothetical protein JNK82_11445 [Myxococcaceae bacterium]|nr:hypothetical protein [Myxococcaceae bacterium]